MLNASRLIVARVAVLATSVLSPVGVTTVELATGAPTVAFVIVPTAASIALTSFTLAEQAGEVLLPLADLLFGGRSQSQTDSSERLQPTGLSKKAKVLNSRFQVQIAPSFCFHRWPWDDDGPQRWPQRITEWM